MAGHTGGQMLKWCFGEVMKPNKVNNAPRYSGCQVILPIARVSLQAVDHVAKNYSLTSTHSLHHACIAVVLKTLVVLPTRL